jgi:molybdopterin molybdotransferase
MPPLPLADARNVVLRETAKLHHAAQVGHLPQPQRQGSASPIVLDDCDDLPLATAAPADRDQPPFDRVTRDGFAVRAADVPGTLTVIGEAPPGKPFPAPLANGQAIEIMTGAALPDGADAVVMVEHTERPSPTQVTIGRSIAPGENIVPQGRELAAGAEAYPAHRRLDPAGIALLASLGISHPTVYARPRVAIIATGDELVDITDTPTPTQIRNSNRHGLAAQIVRAGGTPVPRPIARDNPEMLREVISAALPNTDLLLLSGGVSTGKYDLVEPILKELGAKIIFDGVAIRPGRPLVFGTIGDIPFFGLPGNPLSTALTFELFVRPALDIVGGADPTPLRYTYARLATDYTQRAAPLTVFVPAVLEGSTPRDTAVRPLQTQGSGDLAALARADCWMVLEPNTTSVAKDSFVALLPK